MKIKANEVALPSTVKRGRLDLTEARKLAALAGPMTEKEKSIIEGELKDAIEVITSKENLLKVQELALKETLGDIKKARQALTTAGKTQADSQVQPTADKSSTGEASAGEQPASADDNSSAGEAQTDEQTSSTADQPATEEVHTGGEATS